MPAPETLIVFVPLVLSEFTVTVPLQFVTDSGANVTVTFVALPGAIVPLHAPLKQAGYVMFVTVSDVLPLLVIVSVAAEVCPVTTLPKVRLPLRPMIFVGATVVIIISPLGEPSGLAMPEIAERTIIADESMMEPPPPLPP